MPNIWVAGGRGTNNMAYSQDGINWFQVPDSNNIITSECRGVAWNGTMWVAVGGTGTVDPSRNSIAYSYNGINWNQVTGSPAVATIGNGLAWNNSFQNRQTGTGFTEIGFNPPMWIGVSNNSPTQLCRSYDGLFWEPVN